MSDVAVRIRQNERQNKQEYNNNYYYLLQLGFYPVAVVILHVNKT